MNEKTIQLNIKTCRNWSNNRNSKLFEMNSNLSESYLKLTEERFYRETLKHSLLFNVKMMFQNIRIKHKTLQLFKQMSLLKFPNYFHVFLLYP